MNVPIMGTDRKKIAVIGAGAAGLVSAKVLLQNGFDVTVYEKAGNVGGVWNYAESNAMYDSLRTNLPKEIMAFSIDDPFTEADMDNSNPHSFLTHYEVQRYLERFAHTYDLWQHIKFGHSVQQVYKSVGSHLWTVEVCDRVNVSSHLYNAVLVCNGHFNVPYTPEDTPGFTEYFHGESYHSNRYDQVKNLLTGKNVLVVGGMSSGTDMAKELLTIATNVYVADRSSSLYADIHTLYDNVAPNLHILPGINSIQEDGSVLFTNGAIQKVDVILWCTGYVYDFPFLAKDYTPECTVKIGDVHVSVVDCNANTAQRTSSDCYGDTSTTANNNTTNVNAPRSIHIPCPVEIEHDRCVRPLYQQLFAIQDPSLVIMGLPFRVVPFPLFYYQAQYVAAVFTGRTALPSLTEQYQWLETFEHHLRATNMYQTKYHFLGGPPQWDYCKFLAEQGGLIRNDTSTSPDESDDSGSCSRTESTVSIIPSTSFASEQHAQYLSMLESIYDDNMIHRVLYPGAPDTYRERVYSVDRSDFTWTVV